MREYIDNILQEIDSEIDNFDFYDCDIIGASLRMVWDKVAKTTQPLFNLCKDWISVLIQFIHGEFDGITY